MEAMHFGGVLHHILKQVLTADLRLGLVYLGKEDLADAYMRLWVRMEDVQFFDFLTPKKPLSNQQLIGFHLSLPIGYINRYPYFCMDIETVSDLAKNTIAHRDVASANPLEQAAEARAADDTSAEDQDDASWEQLLAEQRSAATENIDVYLDDFIYIFQGGSKERPQMLQKIFSKIDRVFCPNKAAET